MICSRDYKQARIPVQRGFLSGGDVMLMCPQLEKNWVVDIFVGLYLSIFHFFNFIVENFR